MVCWEDEELDNRYSSVSGEVDSFEVNIYRWWTLRQVRKSVNKVCYSCACVDKTVRSILVDIAVFQEVGDFQEMGE
jgi:hypothetical protein